MWIVEERGQLVQTVRVQGEGEDDGREQTGLSNQVKECLWEISAR